MTDRQEEYLLLFAELNNSERCISNASETFGVSKAAVSTLTAALEKKGYIQKSLFGAVTLTELGRTYIEPKLNQMKRLEKWLESGIGLPPNLAESEARRMVVILEPETVDRILLLWTGEKNVLSPVLADSLFRDLPIGKYEIPFRLCKKGTQSLSMGDRGFQKPATLVRETDRCFLLLYPLEIQCRLGQSPRADTGTVKRLWYHCENTWHELQLHKSGAYIAPVSVLQCEENTEGYTGRVCVRVRPTVSLLKMPESEADLVFQLDAIRSCGNLAEKPDGMTNGVI